MTDACSQARIDSTEETVVGVNKYRLQKQETVPILSIDNSAVRGSQIARLNRVKGERDNQLVQSSLDRLSAAAADFSAKQAAGATRGAGFSENDNLLSLAVNAARARATLGEISAALESVWGRHVASTQVVQGAYSASYNVDAAKSAYILPFHLDRFFSSFFFICLYVN
jgi:methylmalonyl-CoA mutase